MSRRDQLCRSFAVPETPRAREVLMVISIAQAPVRDPLTGTRRVDKATVPRVDPHVIDVATVDTEEDEIAGGQSG